MTYTIPADSPKAVVAAAFGRELLAACQARDVSLKELSRTLGVGHTTLWHYRTGRTVPRMAMAATLATALDWPKLRQLVERARTRTCRRTGCRVSFINDVGSEARKYCSPVCAEIADRQKQAQALARSAGQTGSHQARRAHIQRLRSAVRIADERANGMAGAIAAMCAGCEPEGLCRTADCPLRQFSPLPLRAGVIGVLTTETRIRAERVHGPAARAKRSAAMLAHHADPEYAARHSASLVAAFARQTPEQKAAQVAKAKASYPAERRSVVSKAMHAARRQEATA